MILGYGELSCVTFVKYLNSQVAEVKEAPRRSVLYKHHILKADRCAYDPTPGENMEDTTHAYLRPVSLVELDTFVTAHAPGAELHGATLKLQNR